MSRIKEKKTSLLIQNRQESLASFSSIEHRLEVVREMNDVLWINDSKSTDMGASCFSLENLPENIIWIVGYDENKRNLDIITDVAVNKVDHIICYGHFETEIKYHFASKIKYAYKKEFSDAIQLAHSNALPGQIVLFSPACSSYLNYENFRERGNHFKTLVEQL